jgi:hypothetical protein
MRDEAEHEDDLRSTERDNVGVGDIGGRKVEIFLDGEGEEWWKGVPSEERRVSRKHVRR